jgi:L-arabinose isomerase
VSEEIDKDLKRFEVTEFDHAVHERSVRAGFVLRKFIEENELTAFSVNFMDVDEESGFDCVPFLEISKQMAAGVGYAGEGDVLTAALTGALAEVYPKTTFTEMFCPDWKGNSIFISHMGEINLNLVAGRARLAEKDFPFTSAKNPLVAYGRYMQGLAVLVNIAPEGDGKYKLILGQAEVLDIKGRDKMEDTVHGWIRPQVSISEFLKEYSLAGGTHHLTMVYGDVLKELEQMGKMLGFSVKII